MREIKFRGKRKDSGEWVVGSLIQLGTLRYILPIEIDQSAFKDCWIEVERATVGQYAGLKDKNGKEIYERDMLEYRHRAVGDSNVVTYQDGSFMLTGKNGNRFYPYNAEVIGNIYDNPIATDVKHSLPDLLNI